VVSHINRYLSERKLKRSESEVLKKYLARISFYKKIESFGYELFLKPVKIYRQHGSVQKKANCDVEMAFYLMREIREYKNVVVLSGDGDFLPVLKYLREKNKKVIILARGPRTAREIRLFAGADFRDFEYLKYQIGMGTKKRSGLI